MEKLSGKKMKETETDDQRKTRLMKQWDEQEKQCTHIRCIKVNNGWRWSGKSGAGSDVYKLDFHAMVERSFKSQFLNHCRKFPGLFVTIPVTRGRGEVAEDDDTFFVAPRDGAPVVLYRQGPTDGCMFCGLASGLAYFGDQRLARAIYDLQKEAKSNPSDWDLILHRCIVIIIQ